VVLLPSGYHLLVGRDVQDRVALRAEIVSSLVWTALVALVLAIAGGLLVRRAVLARVAGLNQTVNAIVHGDLSRRMTAQATGDEFDQLARTINGMLDQIQLLIEGARNTSDAIAHDLRTPLAELRARLESVLRSRPGDGAAMDEVEKAVADTDRLIGVFNALLRLADVKSGVRRSGFRDLDPAQVAAEVFELYEPAAEAKGIKLSLAAPHGYSVYGDPHLLSQALANLIDNAIKFTESGGMIELHLRAAVPGQLEMAVADDGPGIPDSEKSRVIEKFQRGKGQETKPGSGLGLSLVDAIARLHGGTFSLADNHPGLIASLSLPLKQGSERALARPAKALPAPA
jgi:signal transduction histidine kinase